MGSIQGRDIPKSLKIVLVAPHLALRLTRQSGHVAPESQMDVVFYWSCFED